MCAECQNAHTKFPHALCTWPALAQLALLALLLHCFCTARPFAPLRLSGRAPSSQPRQASRAAELAAKLTCRRRSGAPTPLGSPARRRQHDAAATLAAARTGAPEQSRAEQRRERERVPLTTGRQRHSGNSRQSAARQLPSHSTWPPASCHLPLGALLLRRPPCSTLAVCLHPRLFL